MGIFIAEAQRNFDLGITHQRFGNRPAIHNIFKTIKAYTIFYSLQEFFVVE